MDDRTEMRVDLLSDHAINVYISDLGGRWCWLTVERVDGTESRSIQVPGLSVSEVRNATEIPATFFSFGGYNTNGLPPVCVELKLSESCVQSDLPPFAIPSVHSALGIAKCFRCNDFVAGLRTCSRCKAVTYCSKECQKHHWQHHRPACLEAEEKNKSRPVALPEGIQIRPIPSPFEDSLNHIPYSKYCEACNVKRDEMGNGQALLIATDKVSVQAVHLDRQYYLAFDTNDEEIPAHVKIDSDLGRQIFAGKSTFISIAFLSVDRQRRALVFKPIELFLRAGTYTLEWAGLPHSLVPTTLMLLDRCECFACGKKVRKVSVCERCRMAIYCSRKCQRSHYHYHRSNCLVIDENTPRSPQQA